MHDGERATGARRVPLGLCESCAAPGACRLGLSRGVLGDDGILRAVARCPSDHQGTRGFAHGGWIASVLEELMGGVAFAHGCPALTASLTVNFVAPVPIGRDLHVRAWRERCDDRRWQIAADLRLEGSTADLAIAHGLWIDAVAR